jgi:N-acetylglucosamine-6-phosphate deacetylase
VTKRHTGFGNKGEAQWVEEDFGFEGYLVPGLVDIHCHGYAGLDVMAGEGATMLPLLRELGIEWACPTTVTASWQEIRQALAPLAARPQGFAGVHLEGPFLNPSKAGAQPAGAIRPFDFQEIRRELGDLLPLVSIVTLAPELSGATELIESLTGAGIRVSAGHTDATYEQMASAHRAGLAQMTHFYNAMRPFAHRDPGCVGYGLNQPIECEVIYDRHHVAKPAMEILWRCRGPNQVLGISDGTMLSGLPDGTRTEMWGQEVVKQGGCIRLANGTLAGSAATLADVFANLWQDVSPEAAIHACSLNPRRALRLPAPELWAKVGPDGRIVGAVEGKLPLAEFG